MRELNERQRRFVLEYLALPNATQAAIQAGYSAKTAKYTGRDLLKDPRIQEHLQATAEKIGQDKIATVQEILEYLTAVMRGQSEATIVVVEKIGDGCTRAKYITKLPDEKERLRAAELLGKRFGLFTDKISLEGTARVIIIDDLNTEENSQSLPPEQFIKRPNGLPDPRER